MKPIVITPKRKMLNAQSTTQYIDSLMSYVNSVIEDKLKKLSLNTDTDLTGHIADISTHGVSGAIVGTSESQELTNKTLTTTTAKGTWAASGTWTLPAMTLGGTIMAGTALPSSDPAVVGKLWYVAATGVVMRSAG